MPNQSVVLLLLIAMTWLFAGCSGSSKKTLVVYSPHGKEMLGEFEKAFEKANPDVDVQWLDMGSQEVFDRIRTESTNAQADLWWGAPATMFMRAETLGLLTPYKPSWSAQVPAAAKSKTDGWYGTFSTPEVIAFNRNTLSEATAPQDWSDIVSPAWKDKVVLRNPMASGTLRAIFCGMIEQSVQRTGKEDSGWIWLKQLHTNGPDYAADPTQLYTRLGGNKPMVTLWNMPDIVLQAEKYKYPFGYVFPKNGTLVVTDGIALIKGSRQPELAKAFYEFVTTKESLLIQAEKYYRIPARVDMPQEKLPNWLKSVSYKTLNTNWPMIAENEANWMKQWDATIKSNP